jgi:hypothetical protein
MCKANGDTSIEMFDGGILSSAEPAYWHDDITR